MKKLCKNISKKNQESLLIRFVIALFVGILFAVTIDYSLLLLRFIWRLFAKIDLVLNSNILLCIFKYFLRIIVFTAIIFVLEEILNKRKEKKDTQKAVKRIFKSSYDIVNEKIIPKMKALVSENRLDKSTLYNNQEIDSFIQSPLEYVNSIIHGNQVPKFHTGSSYAAYQDFLFDEKVNYIVVITAENPNMFLDPTIGFFMSNCYATSIIRHINDFTIKTKHDIGEKIELKTEDSGDFEEKTIIPQRQEIIEKLKRGDKLDGFEFIRFFIFDEEQRKSCCNAVFPSLKASQDLFRIFSFYIQKEELEENELNNLKHYNKQIWSLFNEFCKNRPKAKEQKNERISNFIPEFVFVFKKSVIEIHTYLGGEYWKESVELSKANDINAFIAKLANYIGNNPAKTQLSLNEMQKNKAKSFINWEWKS